MFLIAANDLGGGDAEGGVAGGSLQTDFWDEMPFKDTDMDADITDDENVDESLNSDELLEDAIAPGNYIPLPNSRRPTSELSALFLIAADDLGGGGAEGGVDGCKDRL